MRFPGRAFHCTIKGLFETGRYFFRSTGSCGICLFLFSWAVGPSQGLGSSILDTKSILEKLHDAYGKVENYQARVEIRNYRVHGSVETLSFLYTFRKPDFIRLDMESPHRGMVLLFPDREGKVVVRPSGWLRLFKFRLNPDSAFLKDPSGQRIDQTDMGLLIENITRSLTEEHQGKVEIVEEDETIRVRVEAANHFREGISTRYQFVIDRRLWLPVKVEESDREGHPERSVIFRDLRLNLQIPDGFFSTGGD